MTSLFCAAHRVIFCITQQLSFNWLLWAQTYLARKCPHFFWIPPKLRHVWFLLFLGKNPLLKRGTNIWAHYWKTQVRKIIFSNFSWKPLDIASWWIHKPSSSCSWSLLQPPSTEHFRMAASEDQLEAENLLVLIFQRCLFLTPDDWTNNLKKNPKGKYS